MDDFQECNHECPFSGPLFPRDYSVVQQNESEYKRVNARTSSVGRESSKNSLQWRYGCDVFTPSAA